ncbi:MAG: PAS domain S-box protein [Bacteroidales bacterium]|nr:PAS domain S-box protein [Bacteroidales bacterium]
MTGTDKTREQLLKENEQLKETIIALEKTVSDSGHYSILQEENLRSIFDNMGDVYYQLDKNGIIISASPAAVSLYKYDSLDDIIGRHVSDFVYDPDKNEKLIEELYRKKFIRNYPIVHKRKDGEQITVEANSTALFDDKGELAGVVGVLHDITDRKQAERELKKLTTAVEQSANTIVITDIDGNIEYTNPKFTDLTGYTASEALGQNPRVLNAGTQPEEYYEEMWKTISQGKIWKGEFHNKSKEGRLFWENVTISPIKDEKGCIINYLAVKEDITEKKAAEQALKLSEDRFRGLFEKSGDPILIIENGKFTDCNQATIDILGYGSKEDIINSHPVKISPEIQSDGRSSIPKADELMKIALEKGTHRFEWEHKKSDGVIFPVEVLLTAILNDSNKKILHVVWRDITVRKKAELNLVAALEMAKESDQLKSAFLANMSHEIRTPMNGILGFSELLKEPGLSGDEKNNYISVIEQSGNRMLNTINDLIEMSKLEAGQMYVSITEVNVRKQLEYIYNFFKPEVDKNGLQFSLSTNTSGSDISIKTDKEKLYGILTNLVKNAIKYTNEGSIIFGCKVKDYSIEFFVEDTGIGIPQDQQITVFERFIQVDMTKTRSYEGAGLGLAITKANVELLGGKIWVESKEGKGSTFYFTIPS